MACFMAFLMQLAVKPEVLRVSPTHKAKLLNSAASAVVQSATTTETPLLDVGLDGKDEVIQVRRLRSDGSIVNTSDAYVILSQNGTKHYKIYTPTLIDSTIV